ncbi:Peroxiredoxin [Eubacterium uniforme]|uniref:Peroxiredoxin n=1 Tax=Eubacterium uniforme TaxID=39495 RepID=A0A1T4VJD5_9FIRM|nr:redoxin domain-containing protein [Eubacterium uniforme]SKA64691.1 Peroxiredoxin [Eubacterium uniforme]
MLKIKRKMISVIMIISMLCSQMNCFCDLVFANPETEQSNFEFYFYDANGNEFSTVSTGKPKVMIFGGYNNRYTDDVMKKLESGYKGHSCVDLYYIEESISFEETDVLHTIEEQYKNIDGLQVMAATTEYCTYYLSNYFVTFAPDKLVQLCDDNGECQTVFYYPVVVYISASNEVLDVEMTNIVDVMNIDQRICELFPECVVCKDCREYNGNEIGENCSKTTLPCDNLDYVFETVGGTLATTRSNGKSKILIFAQPYCSYCHSELEGLNNNFESYKDIDIAVIDIYDYSLEALKRGFSDKYTNLNMDVCKDTNDVGEKYMEYLRCDSRIYTPTTVIIGADNKIIGYYVGYSEYLYQWILGDIENYKAKGDGTTCIGDECYDMSEDKTCIGDECENDINSDSKINLNNKKLNKLKISSATKSINGKKTKIKLSKKLQSEAAGIVIRVYDAKAGAKVLNKNYLVKKTVAGNKKTYSLSAKKLKGKRNIYVRVRAYKVADGKKKYGEWSDVKKVKTY